MAAAASQLEALCIPLREIQESFTVSELAIMGWRSAETSAALERSSKKAKAESKDADASVSDKEKMLEQAIKPYRKKLINEQGEVDMRRLTGAEACAYMTSIGIPLIYMPTPKVKKNA